MNAKSFYLICSLVTMLFFLPLNQIVWSQSQLDCSMCHSNIHEQWAQGNHSDTQIDVADELAEERIGESPNDVINGSDPENCIACHGPLAVTKNNGMTEVEALGHFFTTENGVFSSNTVASDTANWPHVFCTTCHNVPSDHPASLPVFAYFNSTAMQYDSIEKFSSLCGHCHGTLRFEDTDHLTYDAWKMNKHSLSQDDVADELAEERSGESADEVINGEDPENCIACHGPTAILANGGMTESEALDYFFTTQNDTFFASTISQHQHEWPHVSCISCHNPHDPKAHSYFNSSTGEYEVFENSAELCGQCHGNLRFEDTDHLSYNIEKGIGAVGVTFTETMPGVTCTDCHMYASDEDGSNSAMYHGHSWAIFVDEEDNNKTASCTSCHESMNAASSETTIQSFQSQTQARLDSAEQIIQLAENSMQGNTDEALKAKLDEAQNNLLLVESDESGGFHNQHFQMDLLADVIQKSHEIVNATGVAEPKIAQAPRDYALFQNYPNPFNPSTKISYVIPKRSHLTIEIFNILGKRVRLLVDATQEAGQYSIEWDSRNDLGQELPNGIYTYRMKTAEYHALKKMTLMK